MTSLDFRGIGEGGGPNDEDLQAMARFCPALQRLHLGGCEAVTDVGVACLGTGHGARLLKSLSLEDCTQVSDQVPSPPPPSLTPSPLLSQCGCLFHLVAYLLHTAFEFNSHILIPGSPPPSDGLHGVGGDQSTWLLAAHQPLPAIHHRAVSLSEVSGFATGPKYR